MTALVCVECDARVYPTSKVAKAYRCADCGDTLCSDHAQFYMDDTNAAITRNSPPRCEPCYGIYTLNLDGTLTIRNLLLSGDYPHRDTARARFRIRLTERGSVVAR